MTWRQSSIFWSRKLVWQWGLSRWLKNSRGSKCTFSLKVTLQNSVQRSDRGPIQTNFRPQRVWEIISKISKISLSPYKRCQISAGNFAVQIRDVQEQLTMTYRTVVVIIMIMWRIVLWFGWRILFHRHHWPLSKHTPTAVIEMTYDSSKQMDLLDIINRVPVVSSNSFSMVIAFYALLLSSHLIHASFTTEVLRPEFERAFNEQCTAKKYPFIKEFFENQSNSTARYMYIIIQERGLGDRVAALLTATAIAVRFRRKLIIQSNDGFDILFAPHRSDYSAGSSADSSRVSYHFLDFGEFWGKAQLFPTITTDSVATFCERWE